MGCNCLYIYHNIFQLFSSVFRRFGFSLMVLVREKSGCSIVGAMLQSFVSFFCPCLLHLWLEFHDWHHWQDVFAGGLLGLLFVTGTPLIKLSPCLQWLCIVIKLSPCLHWSCIVYCYRILLNRNLFFVYFGKNWKKFFFSSFLNRNLFLLLF